LAGPVTVRTADLDDPADQTAVIELLDMYARDPVGQNSPLTEQARALLIPGLRAHPGTLVFLACVGGEAIGLAVCFRGFSTFRAAPLLNIHDLAVRPDFRGIGVGRALLDAIEREACRGGCCKLTLEVRADNHIARRLYRRFGFDPGDGETSAYGFWTKTLGD
jgi:GNAT superfamily N-acetyltransferase